MFIDMQTVMFCTSPWLVRTINCYRIRMAILIMHDQNAVIIQNVEYLYTYCKFVTECQQYLLLSMSNIAQSMKNVIFVI